MLPDQATKRNIKALTLFSLLLAIFIFAIGCTILVRTGSSKNKILEAYDAAAQVFLWIGLLISVSQIALLFQARKLFVKNEKN